MICKHIALFVPDLRAAEEFYRRIFGMDLLFRESEVGGEESWYTLPPENGWEDAEMAGIELAMVALKRDEFILALFRGAPQHGTVSEICFGLAADEIEVVQARLRDEPISSEHSERWLRFDDPFGFRWTLQEPNVAFKSSGEIAERWLRPLTQLSWSSTSGAFEAGVQQRLVGLVEPVRSRGHEPRS